MSYLVLSSCGIDNIKGGKGPAGANCYDEVGDSNGDGFINVEDCIGAKGNDGVDGRDGDTGPAGDGGDTGPRGDKGRDGIDGNDGVDGTDGTNGIDGIDGAGITIVDPCDDDPDNLDEVLIRLGDGTLLGTIKVGNQVFLTALVAGDHSTRDDQSCDYTVDEFNNVSWE